MSLSLPDVPKPPPGSRIIFPKSKSDGHSPAQGPPFRVSQRPQDRLNSPTYSMALISPLTLTQPLPSPGRLITGQARPGRPPPSSSTLRSHSSQSLPLCPERPLLLAWLILNYLSSPTWKISFSKARLLSDTWLNHCGVYSGFQLLYSSLHHQFVMARDSTNLVNIDKPAQKPSPGLGGQDTGEGWPGNTLGTHCSVRKAASQTEL